MTAGRPLRGPEPEGGGFAAAHLQGSAAAPGAGGRAARGYGAGPPASRLLRTAARRPAAGLDPGDLCGPSGRKYRQAPACPGPGRGASGAPCPAYKRTPGKRSELVFDNQKKRRNYTNRL